jgi:hypothetical protein
MAVSERMPRTATAAGLLDRWFRRTGHAVMDPWQRVAGWARNHQLLGAADHDFTPPPWLEAIGRRGAGRSWGHRFRWHAAEGAATVGWAMLSVMTTIAVAAGTLATAILWLGLLVPPVLGLAVVAAGEGVGRGVRGAVQRLNGGVAPSRDGSPGATVERPLGVGVSTERHQRTPNAPSVSRPAAGVTPVVPVRRGLERDLDL